MPSYNKVILIGNLTRDPELKYTPKGAAICDIGIAVNRKWKTEGGQEQEEVAFIDCTAFGKTAETVAKFFRKGAPIMVEGRLKMDSWEDRQTNQQRTKLKVVLESFTFVGGEKDSDSNREERTRQPRQSNPQHSTDTDDDSDVPF